VIFKIVYVYVMIKKHTLKRQLTVMRFFGFHKIKSQKWLLFKAFLQTFLEQSNKEND
jgi:hypothetical protein